MISRFLSPLIAFTVVLFCAGNALADVTSLTIISPTAGNQALVDAGSSFPVIISYTWDGSGGANVDLGIKLLSGSTVVGSTNMTLTPPSPGSTTNTLTFVVANCALNGTNVLSVAATNGTVVSTSQASAVVISGGTPAAFNVTGGGAYCSGGSGVPIGLSGSEFGVNYQLKKGAANTGSAVAGTGSAISFGNKIFGGTYSVVATNAVSGCAATMTGSVTVTINPASVGGTASTSVGTFCSGSSSTISLSGQSGTIVEWQYTTDDGDTWTSIATSANPLDTGALTITTYYQALVANGECVPAYSSIAGVMVDPLTVGGTATATAATVCSGSSTTITLSGETGTIVRWETSLDGSTWTTNATTANPLNTGNLTATKHFRAVVQSGLCSQATSAEALVTVNPATVGGTTAAAAGTICSGSSTTISLSGQTGSIVRWESSTDGATWTTTGSTANPLDTGNLTATTQFRAKVQSGGCTVLDSSAATVTVNPVSVGGSATPTDTTLCSGSSTTITLSGQTGAILRWETSLDGSTWTTNATTANPLNTGNLTATKHFRAVVQSGLCSPATSAEAVVTVNPATVGGTTAAAVGTICSGSSTTITLSGQTGSIVRWESSTDGATWTTTGSTANPLDTGNLTASTQFRAKVQSGGCAMVDSSAATVTVNPVSVGGTATPADTILCSCSSTTITLSGQTGAIVRWETSLDGSIWTTNATTANPLNTGNLTATKHFRAVVQSGLCSPATSAEAVVTVNPATVGGTATAAAGTICSGSSTMITLGGQTGAIVRWESSTDGTTWTTNGWTANPLDTGNLTATTQFRAKVQSGGCAMLDSSAATVTVNPASVGGTATPTDATLCSGSSTTIALSGQTGSIVKWQSSANGSDWTDVLTTANPLNTGNLTATKHFRALVQSGDCSTANSSAAVVTVNPPPAITSQPSSAIKLVGASVSFSVTANYATAYQWRINGSVISGATLSTYTINPGSAASAASYDCMLAGASPCATTTSSAATLAVGSKLDFSSEPVNTTAGATMSAVEVQIQDQSGNGIAVSGVTIFLALNGSGTLGGTASVATDANGKATFSTLSITKADTGYILTGARQDSSSSD